MMVSLMLSDVSTIPSPSMPSATGDERAFQATSHVTPPVLFDDLPAWLQSSATQTYIQSGGVRFNTK